jgi:hypothetical protein
MNISSSVNFVITDTRHKLTDGLRRVKDSRRNFLNRGNLAAWAGRGTCLGA